MKKFFKNLIIVIVGLIIIISVMVIAGLPIIMSINLNNWFWLLLYIPLTALLITIIEE